VHLDEAEVLRGSRRSAPMASIVPGSPAACIARACVMPSASTWSSQAASKSPVSAPEPRKVAL
jgi:hypothetical protein